jgi:hypothetical protein
LREVVASGWLELNAREVFVTHSCDSSHDALAADLSNGRPKKTSTAPVVARINQTHFVSENRWNLRSRRSALP